MGVRTGNPAWVDSADAADAAANPGRKITAAKLNAIEAAIDALGGSSSLTADDNPEVPAEGSSASYLVSSAVTWPAGLVWSTDPDGGEEPVIDDYALVSLFTLGGVTRAVMGATFPAVAAPEDTTGPTAGTLGVVVGVTSADGTVTGAEDETELDAAPYSFRVDAGSWSAWQAGNTYEWTGLTAETEYDFQHRVRDAAGNITEGAVVTDTTDPVPADTTDPTPGTLAASSITDTDFTLTVTGASDETALHAEPYRFSTDDGATYSAWQSAATFDATELDPETAYDCIHQVRDAALNVATGTAITVTTEPASSTTFFTDFSEYTTDAMPSGWTIHWNSPGLVNSGVKEDAGLTGGKFLHLEASSVRVGLSPDSLGTVSGPVEVVTRFRAPVSGFIAHAIRIYGSGDNADSAGYFANFSPTTSKAAKYTAGTSSDLGTPASRTLAANTWSWARMRVDSGTVYLRWWADGDTEPATWNVEVADATHTSGWVGVGAYKNVDFDVVGIAVGGGTAPKVAP